MVREQREYSATFMGVSFFRGARRDVAADKLGAAVRRARRRADPEGRSRPQGQDGPAAPLVGARALQSYKREHGNYPARLVVHKTSRFHPEECEGFQKAIEQSEIEIADFIWMPRRSPVRLFPNGVYPPLRGTAMRLDNAQTILYTRGSVDFFRTYPGLYVPNPLVLHAQRRDTPDWNLLLKETLALTKMNWNGTQFDGALPITLKAARQVGDILKYVPDGTTPDPRYRFYM
jgi:hypothetical protein